jgi:hypothetical protein
MAGRYTTDRAHVYDALEDTLAALDVARAGVLAALAAAGYPHIRENDVMGKKEATAAATDVA